MDSTQKAPLKKRLEFTIDQDNYLDGITRDEIQTVLLSLMGLTSWRSITITMVQTIRDASWVPLTAGRDRPPVDPLHAGPSNQSGDPKWSACRGPGLMAVTW